MGLLYRDGLLLIPGQPEREILAHPGGKAGIAGGTVRSGQTAFSDDLEVCDSDGGIRCLKEAAGNGNHFAAYRLGKKYLSGEVVSKDAVRVTERLT